MRPNRSHNLLEIAEYLSLAAAIAGIIAAGAFNQNNYATIPIVFSLLLNLINRNRLELKTRATAASTIERLNQHKASVEQLIDQLKVTITSLAAINPQIEYNGKNADSTENVNSIVSALQHLRQRENILETTIKLVQTELETINKQFKQRPELEQVENLTRVILDLQQFINQLPQWGNLQQRQLIELQEKVDRALANLSTEMERISDKIEIEVQRQFQKIDR
ncbi:hypothetical protein BCD67_24970 [Oscillatoriales cyanobacterium USR001]|nr:hypothetical protein BCD67_24970 [Oscillatoriales cyanobacterium USR001]